MNISYRHKARLQQVETEWARLGMQSCWETRSHPALGKYVVRKMPGGEQHVPLRTIRSHFKKRGATQQLAWSGAPGSVIQKCALHNNISTKMLYMQQEAVDLQPARQLLNAPPHLLHAGRSFSLLDVMAEVKRGNQETALLLRKIESDQQKRLFGAMHQATGVISSMCTMMNTMMMNPAMAAAMVPTVMEQVFLYIDIIVACS